MFDLSKAYDNVPHNLLIERLKQIIKDQPNEMILINHILNSVSIKIKENDNPIKLNKGVPQGYSLSPLLFNVFINGLVT